MIRGQTGECTDDLAGGVLALHSRRRQHEIQRGVAPLPDVQHVVDHGASLGRNDSDAAGHSRQWPFALLSEQPFFFEPHSHRLEMRAERASIAWENDVSDELEDRPLLVNADGAVHERRVARGERQGLPTQSRAEHDRR